MSSNMWLGLAFTIGDRSTPIRHLSRRWKMLTSAGTIRTHPPRPHLWTPKTRISAMMVLDA
ncbi:hypothetical protein SCLCIDRAFT_1215271 [Scleroderma citrinum Foug A]|uniref:Uncharacterized protein n=1 Tax=Scleroderma citrinum Foug A TaxID=1036808 RepID=A0A0C3ABD6_9AGAM|nr:hypothetical protein SCLCIDRAFT_1215271 [Scleroderma citrinum Foug A]